ncbi:MAG: FKBP-type peptidyl-prolyl cis-trans isomerase N-terminal domain-containing protein, partial [Spirochaetales bacterium]|nr:FKBP-type peptidyl-prolyl cis-trans isomerase N-terminal domain-containing protein [Spirochaetales bacterium]
MTISKKSIVILCVVCVIAFILGYAIGHINPSSSESAQPQVTETIESPSDENPSSITGENRFAYLIGNATMSNMKGEYSYYGFDDNAITDAMNNLIKGITDANEGIEVSEEERQEIEDAFRERIDEITKIIADKNIVIAQEFLDENKKREGVIETESGLQYEVIRQGGGTLAGENADVV